MRRRHVAFGIALLIAITVLAPLVAQAREPVLTAGPRPYGSLFRALAGDTLEQDFGIGVIGFSHLTAAVASRDIATTLLPQGRGRNLQPQGGLVQDEGLNLNQLGLMICKGAGCPPGRLFEANRNVLSRITPLPGPRGNEVIIDWNLSAIYGEDAFFWKTKGFDDWDFDVRERNKLAFTQWFLDIYLPVGAGASLLLGSFQAPLGNEIGYAFVPPNWFSARTYAFAVSPAKHVGALVQFKLPETVGIASVSFGVVSDWSGVDFGSGDTQPGYIFAGSWRSADMHTWLDLEVSYGNGEDDFGDVTIKDGVARALGGGSQFLALSSTDEYLDRVVAFLNVTHRLDDNWRLAVESAFGFQEGGDRAPLRFAIVRDSAFYGINGALRYRLTDTLHAGARLEWFRDEQAANVLWSGVGAGGGDVYALSVNLAWEPVPHILVRPELKYDVYDGEGSLFAVASNGIARADSQVLGVLNFELRF